MHAQLDAQGLVTEQCVTTNTVGDPELLRCVNELVAMGRYPVGGAPVAGVIFPFHFGASAG